MNTAPPKNFIRDIIDEDLSCGRIQQIVVRFPPEPNGYLHIGHAKSIYLNFSLAQHYGGRCYLRFDDTNPEKEEQRYVDAIQEDIRWLGFQWSGEVRYASDYFEQFYQWALHLIAEGHAYVCDLSAEEASAYRGWATSPGQDSPYRNRSVAENTVLFEKMRAGELDEGACVLRAKIDMSSPNMNLRDPILYRIRQQTHHRTGDQWCIYPSYDFAHGQEDAIEGITHSLCTLEFADHRPLYDWLLEHLPVPHQPRQYEFGRLNITGMPTSKRRLKQFVEQGVVSGWDDPRMPTLAGMRRRGYPPHALRRFCASLAVTKTDGVVDQRQLAFFIRDELNQHAPRTMAVLQPLKVVIVNYPPEKVEILSVPTHPERDDTNASSDDTSASTRELALTREIFIDRNDFKEAYSKKFKKKLSPGKRVRLRHAYVIEAIDAIKDQHGDIVQVNARLLEETLGADPADGDKPKGVVHWVSATHSQRATVRLYDALLTQAAQQDDAINPQSLMVLSDCYVEASLAQAAPEDTFQFEREGYFVADRYDHNLESPVFNRIIGLRDRGTGNGKQETGNGKG